MILDQNINLSVISLDILEQECNISAKSIKVCEVNGLAHLGAIVSLYSKDGDLPKLRGGGAKTDKELKALCKDYNENTFVYENLIKKALWKHQHGDIKPELVDVSPAQKNIIDNYIKLKINSLSPRVAHVVTEQLSNGQDFDNFTLNFLRYKSTLSKFRNIGQKSLQELAFFVETVEAFALGQVQLVDETIELKEVPVGATAKLQAILPQLSDIKKQILSTYLQKEIKKLPQKLRYWLVKALEYQITVDIFVKVFSALKSTEMFELLLNLITKIENKAFYYLDIADDRMPCHGFMELLNLSFDLKHDEEIFFLPMIEKNTFPLFHFFDYLIDYQYLIEGKYIVIFKHRTIYFKQAETLSLDTIGKQMNLTRERVRQLSVSLESKIEYWWQFLMMYSNDIQLFINYKLQKEDDIILIAATLIQEINTVENTCFSKFFCYKTFSQLHGRTHILFGDAFDDFQNAYLIQKNIFEIFSFKSFFETIYQQISDKLYEDLSLDIDGFLYNFTQNDAIDLLPRVRSVCEKIIINEFFDSVEFDFDNNIIFKRNVKVNSYEIVMEILHKKGVPMKVDEIYEIYTEKYFRTAASFENIRSLIAREKEIFIYFGRSSTYGLAEWEETKTDIKGGTIRDLAQTYLQDFDAPKHISELGAYVLQYRPTSNLYSINTNLMYETGKRFKMFKGDFWGLSSKIYEDTDFNDLPPIFLTRLKKMIATSTNPTYEAILTDLCAKFKLKAVQVQYVLEKNIKDGILRHENNLLEIG